MKQEPVAAPAWGKVDALRTRSRGGRAGRLSSAMSASGAKPPAGITRPEGPGNPSRSRSPRAQVRSQAHCLGLTRRGFPRGFREERFDHFFEIGTFTLRTVHFFRLVFLDAHYFGERMVAVAADVFVQRHVLCGCPAFDRNFVCESPGRRSFILLLPF